MYLGSLDRLFGTVAAMLAPGGLFTFTAESHDSDEAMVLRPSRRYAHAEVYLRDLIARSGFEIVHFANVTIRRDGNESVNAHVVVVRLTRSKPVAASAVQPVAVTEQLTLH